MSLDSIQMAADSIHLQLLLVKKMRRSLALQV